MLYVPAVRPLTLTLTLFTARWYITWPTHALPREGVTAAGGR